MNGGQSARAGPDGPRLVQVVFLFLWPFVFSQRPSVSISFAVAGIADVCHYEREMCPWAISKCFGD